MMMLIIIIVNVIVVVSSCVAAHAISVTITIYVIYLFLLYRHTMSGVNLDHRGKRSTYPKDFTVATPEEFVKKFGGNKVINTVSKVLYKALLSFIIAIMYLLEALLSFNCGKQFYTSIYLLLWNIMSETIFSS